MKILVPSRKRRTLAAKSTRCLVDLTDSVKPITPLQSLKKQSLKNKSIPPIADECFLHNHDECIKLQEKVWDLDFDRFWRTPEDLSMYPNLKEFLEMEDIIEDKVDHGSLNPPSPSRIEHLIDLDEFTTPSHHDGRSS